MKYNHPNKVLRRAMLEVAPRVEELTGLKAPRKHGKPVHPRIKWLDGEDWHYKYYAFYRPCKKAIYINPIYARNFVLGGVMIKAVIAHEYTHYLQDLRWKIKDWLDAHKLERFAFEIENYFLPPEYQIDIDQEVSCYDEKGGITELSYTNWSDANGNRNVEDD